MGVICKENVWGGGQLGSRRREGTGGEAMLVGGGGVLWGHAPPSQNFFFNEGHWL